MSIIDEKFDKLPSWLQFVISMIIVISLIFLFIWLNDIFLHLPLGQENTECSGRFEYICGDVDDTRINDNEKYEPSAD